jgi:hypothetical protein
MCLLLTGLRHGSRHGRRPGWSAPENYHAGQDQDDGDRVQDVQRLVDEEPADREPTTGGM